MSRERPAVLNLMGKSMNLSSSPLLLPEVSK